MMKDKRFLVVGAGAVLLSFLVLLLVYSVIDKRDHHLVQTEREYLGDIGSPAKKWLNGYLGIFSRFNQMGNINWLIIPLLVWFLASKKSRQPERWQSALIFVWAVMVVLIAFKGYDNVRYQLTLFPLTSAAVLFLLWLFLDKYGKIAKILGFSLVALFCLFNIYHYFDVYRYYWNLRVSVSSPHFPAQLVEFLRSAPDLDHKSRVLTINQPLFYYHVPRRGVDYVSPHAIGIWVEFMKKSGSVDSRGQLFQLLKRRYGIRYILLSSRYRRFNRSTLLEEFLHCECTPVLEDQGLMLLRLRDQPLEKQLLSPAFFNLKVWDSNQPGLQTISPPLLRFSSRGLFKMEVSKDTADNEKNILSVTYRGGEKKEDRRIHFGYEFNRQGLRLDPGQYEGLYVHFIVRTSVSPNLLNRDNYIAVVDYNKDNTNVAKKTFFTSHHWRTYIVSKKIRPGNARVIFMFRFCPRGIKDRFFIRDARISISKEPLIGNDE